MHASGWRRARGAASAIGPGAAIVLLICWICAARGGDLLAALTACPPWALAAATIAHATTLLLRTEAWRTVLLAASGARLDSRVLHGANAGSFVVGILQSHAALPTRIALLRRLAGTSAPRLFDIAVADAPILALEACTSALLAAVAATAFPAIPAWAPPVLLALALAALAGMAATYERARHSSLCRGFAVMADPAARVRLIGLVAAFTAAALVRTWIVLLAFGLPAGPADAALLLFSMGAIGLLPLGAVGTAPTATVAAMGATDLTAAAAAGIVTGASTVLAALLYAGACWTWALRRPAVELEPEPDNVIALPVVSAEARPELDLAA